MTRHRLALLIALTAIILPKLFTTVAQADSPQLNALASLIAERPITVECFAPDGEYGGYVWVVGGVMESVIHLSGEHCGALQNVLTPTHRTVRWLSTFEGTEAVGAALLDLTHEGTHERLQSSDEGEVECTAVRNVWNITKLLGLPWKVRQRVYRAAVRTHLSMPTEGANSIYRSVC